MAISGVTILGWTSNLDSVTNEVKNITVKYGTFDENGAIVKSNLLLSVPIAEIDDFSDEFTDVEAIQLGKTNIQAYNADLKEFLREKCKRREGLKV